MQVDDAIDAVVPILQLDEALDGAEIVAEVQVAGRLHAGKNPFLKCHAVLSADRASPCHGVGRPRKGRLSGPMPGGDDE